MGRPTLQVISVSTHVDSGQDPRSDDVVVTMRLRRDAATRPVPYHLVDGEVFDAIGDWWDAQVEHDAQYTEPERMLTS